MCMYDYTDEWDVYMYPNVFTLVHVCICKCIHICVCVHDRHQVFSASISAKDRCKMDAASSSPSISASAKDCKMDAANSSLRTSTSKRNLYLNKLDLEGSAARSLLHVRICKVIFAVHQKPYETAGWLKFAPGPTQWIFINNA